MVTFLFAVFCIIVMVIAYKLWPHKISIKEVVLVTVVQLLFIGVFWYASSYSKGADFQILNGEILSKNQVRVSCSHSYSCNCVRICTKNSCSTSCQTCYEHSHDYDWRVQTSVGELNIERIDRQGVKQPERWRDVVIGEPASLEQSYFNYIKAAPFTIFNKAQLQSSIAIPPYQRVYDYYRMKHVINLTKDKIDVDKLDQMIEDSLKSLGNRKKLNILVYFHNQTSEWVEVVKAKRYGGKLNDLTILVKVERGKIVGVNVFSWSKNDLVNVSVRDSLLEIGDVNKVVEIHDAIMSNANKYFQKRGSEEFEYLSNEIRHPNWVITLVFLFGVVWPFAGMYLAKKYEL